MNHSKARHSPDSHTQESVARALEIYAAALDELSPSPHLEARMQASIAGELARRPRRMRLQRWGWAVAASLVVALTGALGVQVLRMQAELAARDAAAANPGAAAVADNARMMVFPTGAVSLWPTQGTVFRVRSTLAGMGSEQQYWVDVRMANDGSMRVERVFAADGTELFARPE